MVLPSYRVLNLLGFLACVFAMAFALWLQHRGYEPCPMCIFQRVAMMGLGLTFLLAGLHAPGGRLGRLGYALPTVLFAASGAAIAGRHVWLQSLPPDQVPACGPTLDYLMELFPLTEVVTMILKGDGNCAKIDAQWLGLSLPTWTLVVFAALTLWAALLPWLPRARR